MMYYEKVLRPLANLEQFNEDTTNDLLGEKFGYIVSHSNRCFKELLSSTSNMGTHANANNNNNAMD